MTLDPLPPPPNEHPFQARVVYWGTAAAKLLVARVAGGSQAKTVRSPSTAAPVTDFTPLKTYPKPPPSYWQRWKAAPSTSLALPAASTTCWLNVKGGGL